MRAQTEVEARPEPAAPQTEPRTVLALIFGFLLFFQFANEWSIAGWLPVFLIDRLGISPAGPDGLRHQERGFLEATRNEQ